MRLPLGGTPGEAAVIRTSHAWALALAVIAGTTTCFPTEDEDKEMTERTRSEVREVLERHKTELMESHGATGAGIGKEDPTDEDYLIVLYLESEDSLPEEEVVVEGVPVLFRITGRIGLQRKREVTDEQGGVR